LAPVAETTKSPWASASNQVIHRFLRGVGCFGIRPR
jgi:hypothetical protein